jgi:ParB family chromosome partitioning protein
MKTERIATDDLAADPDHPRKNFAEGEIAALCEDLRKRGQIMPLIVFSHAGKAVIVDGQRRWISAKRAGLTHLVAIVLPERPPAAELRILQTRLDFHRSPHNLMEKSNLLADIMRTTGWTIGALATELSIPQPAVSKFLSYQKLAPAIQNLLATGALDGEKAFIVSTLADFESQMAMVTESAHLSREALRAKVKNAGKPAVKAKRAVFMLPGGSSIAFKGEEATLEDVIEQLTLTLKELRKGLSQSFDITTVQRVFRDKAKAHHVA